jgi:thiol-disulfide isomerase/thioredoxin
MDLQSYKNIPKNKIVHIVAKWCLACRFNHIPLTKYKNNVIEIDYDEHPEIMQHERITKVPTIIWKNHRIEGVSTLQLRKLLKSFDQQ